jgi:hypothetical protein
MHPTVPARDYGAYCSNVCRKNKQTLRRMSEALVKPRFVESGSIAESKLRVEYLEELELLGP